MLDNRLRDRFHWNPIMNLKLFLSFLLVSSTTLGAIANTKKSIEQKAAEIHARVLTLDSHLDTPIVMNRYDFFDIRNKHDVWGYDSQVDLPRMIEGGLDGGFFVVYLGQGPLTIDGRANAKVRAREIFGTIHTMIDENPDVFELALTAEDGPRIKAEGKHPIYIGIENGYTIGRDLDLLEEFYNLGGRYLTLAHTRNNDICDSSTDPDGYLHGGLSDFGRLVVKEMNRLGMMIDISHISDDAARQVIELSEAPVIASHSSAKAIYDHPRNIPDDILRSLAETGGVIQMNMFSGYLKDLKNNSEHNHALRQWRREYGNLNNLSPERREEAIQARAILEKEFPIDLATLETVLDHIDYIVQLIGIDHIGIGADFDGGGGVIDCYDASEMGNVTLGLVKRGYSEEEIGKIWSGNLLRVLKANEEVARRLQAEE